MKSAATRTVRNVTLAIEDEVLQKARVRAVKEGTTVNELVREFLAHYGTQDDRNESAIKELLQIAAKNKGRMKGKFNREEIYEERLRRGN